MAQDARGRVGVHRRVEVDADGVVVEVVIVVRVDAVHRDQQRG